MCEYIEFCADRLLRELGYENRYHTPNPFIFMNAISLHGKSNFFERKVGEYSNYTAVNKQAAATVLSSGKLNLQVEF